VHNFSADLLKLQAVQAIKQSGPGYFWPTLYCVLGPYVNAGGQHFKIKIAAVPLTTSNLYQSL